MNLREALRARHIPFREETRDPNELSICCPFCIERGFSADNRFRLGVNARSGAGHCFNCDWKSHKNALVILGKKLEMGEIQGGVAEEKKEKVQPVELPADFTLLADVANDDFHWYKQAIKYMREQRGVPWEQIVAKKIGVSLTGRYSHRVIFPVYAGTKLIGIVSRDFTSTQIPPYLNSPGEKGLYNIPPAKSRQASIVIVEGVFDCLSVERAVANITFGLRPDVVALLGRSLTQLQRKQLQEYTDIILWPDNDQPGIEGMSKIAPDLVSRHKMFYVSPLAGMKDAGDLPARVVRSMYDSRVPWSVEVGQRERARMAFQE